MLVDSHCHLDFPDFETDLPEVVRRAGEAGLSRIVTICTRPRLLSVTRKLSESYDPVYFAAGLHPLHAHEEPVPSVDELCAMAEHPKMIGFGESGLDFYRRAETAVAQRNSLQAHIEASWRTGLPVIIHARAADRELGDLLRGAYDQAPFRCVMHCYSSGPELARLALDLGFYLSMSGIITFRNADALRSIFADAPLERILVETDAPYLAPVPYRGKRNESAYVQHTARAGAELKGLSDAEFARATSENFFRLFSKVPRPEMEISHDGG